MTIHLCRVYLKPGFSVSGLEKVLGTPGARVLLRDVQLERKGMLDIASQLGHSYIYYIISFSVIFAI